MGDSNVAEEILNLVSRGKPKARDTVHDLLYE